MRRSRLLVVLAWTVPVAVVVACATTREGNRGAPCDRSSECAPGLFCVERVCSDDLSRLDGGAVPTFDSGSEAMVEDGDAAEVDPDAPPPEDTGAPVDTGTPVDTGMPPVDTGMPPVDTGTPPVDTGTVDTGTPPEDTMSPPEDTSGD